MSGGEYKIKGKVFYVSGRFNGYTQEYIRGVIRQAGGIVRCAPSKRVQIGVVGNGTDPDNPAGVRYSERTWSLETLFDAIKHDMKLKDSK